MCVPEIWEKWALYDEDGICGIKEDAPEEMKKVYKRWKEEQDFLKTQPIRMKK